MGNDAGGCQPVGSVRGQAQSSAQRLHSLVSAVLAAPQDGTLAAADVRVALDKIHTLIADCGLKMDDDGMAGADLRSALHKLDEQMQFMA